MQFGEGPLFLISLFKIVGEWVEVNAHSSLVGSSIDRCKQFIFEFRFVFAYACKPLFSFASIESEPVVSE